MTRHAIETNGVKKYPRVVGDLKSGETLSTAEHLLSAPLQGNNSQCSNSTKHCQNSSKQCSNSTKHCSNSSKHCLNSTKHVSNNTKNCPSKHSTSDSTPLVNEKATSPCVNNKITMVGISPAVCRAVVTDNRKQVKYTTC